MVAKGKMRIVEPLIDYTTVNIYLPEMVVKHGLALLAPQKMVEEMEDREFEGIEKDAS